MVWLFVPEETSLNLLISDFKMAGQKMVTG